MLFIAQTHAIWLCCFRLLVTSSAVFICSMISSRRLTVYHHFRHGNSVRLHRAAMCLQAARQGPADCRKGQQCNGSVCGNKNTAQIRSSRCELLSEWTHHDRWFCQTIRWNPDETQSNKRRYSGLLHQFRAEKLQKSSVTKSPLLQGRAGNFFVSAYWWL